MNILSEWISLLHLCNVLKETIIVSEGLGFLMLEVTFVLVSLEKDDSSRMYVHTKEY